MGEPMGRSAAVTALGWINIVYGLLYVAFGLFIIFAGADAAMKIMQAGAEVKEANKQEGTIQVGTNSEAKLSPEEIKQANQVVDAGATGFASFFMVILGALGICSMIGGLPAILVGWGVLARQQWARILTLIFAVLAILVGLGGLANYSGGAVPIVTGLVHIAYGVFAFVVLLNKQYAAEFVRPRPQVV